MGARSEAVAGLFEEKVPESVALIDHAAEHLGSIRKAIGR